MKCEIFQSVNNKSYLRIVADNGNILALTVKGYPTETSLWTDMGIVLATTRPFEFYVDGNGEWRWRWRMAVGRCIIKASEGYKNKSDCVDIAAKIETYVKGQLLNG